MQSLYPPALDNPRPEFQDRVLDLVQDNVRVDRDSRSYQVLRVLEAAMTQATEFLFRMDPRPWASDLRQTSAVEPASGNETKKRLAEILMGPPEAVEPRRLRTYRYDKKTIVDPRPVETAGFDRAAEDEGGLVVQRGGSLYRVTRQGTPSPVDISGTPPGASDRPVLVSLPNGWTTLVGSPPSSREVASEIDGLDIIVRGAGKFDIELRYTAAAVIQDGDNVTALDRFEDPHYLYDENGDRVGYTIGGDGTISVGLVLEETDRPGAPAGKYLLYYTALATYARRSTNNRDGEGLPYATADLGPIAEDFYEMPTTEDVTAKQNTDSLGAVPMENRTEPVDGEGYAGGVHVGHPIRSAAGSAHHLAVASETNVSVVEPAARARTWTAAPSVPGEILGVTWTAENLLGIVTAEEGQFGVYALDDIRRGRNDGFRPAHQ
jgi:hypothetical protein